MSLIEIQIFHNEKLFNKRIRSVISSFVSAHNIVSKYKQKHTELYEGTEKSVIFY